ncbi:MAG TPA: hypothetical protein GX508_00910 [Coprothermobacter sp.]|nr:hypothetical protein [Coprothermobacter sp.]
MDKILKLTVVLVAIICLLIAGSFVKAKIVEATKPVYTVLVPYDTYMGNYWQVKQLPEIIQDLTDKDVIALVYYPFQDVGRIIDGISGNVILISDEPIRLSERVLWVNIGITSDTRAYLDLSYESLLRDQNTANVVKKKKVCARDDLLALTTQYLWSGTQGVFSVKECPDDALIIGYSESSGHVVVLYDVKTSVDNLIQGKRVRKVTTY